MVHRYVLLGDVIRSREIEDRQAFRDRLAGVCEELTVRESEAIHADFEVLKGVDEFGGVLTSVTSLYDVVVTFQAALAPHRSRIVVAEGEVEQVGDSRRVGGMDGPAFHRADELLTAVGDGPRVVDVRLADEALGHVVADEVNLLLHRRRQWTDRQREVVDAVADAGTQTAAAESLGVTQQAVSNVLASADWPLVDAVESRLRDVLAAYDD